MGKYAFRLLMILLPFMNIISHRIDESAGIYTLLGLYILSFVFSRPHTIIGKKEKHMMRFCLLCALFVIAYAIMALSVGINNMYSIRFFGLFLLLLPFLFKKNAVVFYHDSIAGYLKYLIVLITASIAFGTVLISIGLLELEPMYDPEQYSYWGRPYGLFGQPSVNSTLLCFFYIFYDSLNIKKKKENNFLFFMVTIGVLLQRSGSGFISYFFVLLIKYGIPNNINIQKIPKKFIIIFIIMMFGFVALVLSNKIDKISMNYLIENAEYSRDDLWLHYLASIKSPTYIYFGIPNQGSGDPADDISVDLGPLFIVARVGVIFFVFLLFIFLYLIKKAKQLSMKLAIIMLLIGNLHYPVMFYFIMNFIWFFIIYHILVVNYEEKNGVSRTINVQPQSYIPQSPN